MDIEIQIPQAGCSNFQTEARRIEVGLWIYNCRKLEVGFGRPKLEVEIQLPGVGILNVTSTTWKLEVELQVQEV